MYKAFEICQGLILVIVSGHMSMFWWQSWGLVHQCRGPRVANAYMHRCIRRFITCMPRYILTCTHTYIHIDTCTHMHTYMHHAYMHATYIHVCLTWSEEGDRCSPWCLHTIMYVLVQVVGAVEAAACCLSQMHKEPYADSAPTHLSLDHCRQRDAQKSWGWLYMQPLCR
jgi:hypothetical protein